MRPSCYALNTLLLTKKPAYEALSYVWGPQNPSHPVQCNNDNLAVGGNLRDALRYLRKPDAPRVLWIDRIAINQEDMAERAQQVSLMGDIYSSASLIAIWLGTTDDSTEPAIGLLHGLGGQMIEYMKKHNLKSYLEAQTIKDHFQYSSLEDPIWPAVRSLLQRPWFSRV
ncbi:heterokaryon incompatibility [Halenospora varia]|nr:heterokaryon incompatibility [Halenospora varia]